MAQETISVFLWPRCSLKSVSNHRKSKKLLEIIIGVGYLTGFFFSPRFTSQVLITAVWWAGSKHGAQRVNSRLVTITDILSAHVTELRAVRPWLLLHTAETELYGRVKNESQSVHVHNTRYQQTRLRAPLSLKCISHLLLKAKWVREQKII